MYEPLVSDIEGDSISYELTDCIGVVGYTLPDTFPNFSIDSEFGNIQWNSPLSTGMYAVAFVIKEWRNGIVISHITKQMTIIALDNSFIDLPNKKKYVNIYPNPTTGIIKIDDENVKNVYVINELGKVILNYKNTEEIDISDLPKGIYFIRVVNDTYEFTKKLILE